MWLPHTVTVEAAEPPLTTEEARAQCGITASETNFDDLLAVLIAAAADHVERWTGTKLAPQTVAVSTDCWDDLATLPVAPVQSVTIAYLDGAGDSHALDPSVYELHGAGTLAPGIRLADGQSWPETIANRSAITVTAVCGYGALPGAVKLAMLMLIAQWFETRGAAGQVMADMPNGPAALLANRRMQHRMVA